MIIIIIVCFIKRQCFEGLQWRWRTAAIVCTNTRSKCLAEQESIQPHSSLLLSLKSSQKFGFRSELGRQTRFECIVGQKRMDLVIRNLGQTLLFQFRLTKYRQLPTNCRCLPTVGSPSPTVLCRRPWPRVVLQQLSLWLSGLICFLNHSICWAYGKPN